MHTSLRATADAAFDRLHKEVDALEAESAQLNLEQLFARADIIKQLAEETGANKVVPEYHTGYFKPVHLGDERAKETTSDDDLTLGILTGQAVQPGSLKVSRAPGGKLNTKKVLQEGSLTELVGQVFLIDGTPLQGSVEMAIGMRLDPEAPSTVFARARELVISPQLAEGKEAEQLQQWLDLVLEPNQNQPGKTVDPATGVIRVQMPPVIPESAVYLIANTPELHMLRHKDEYCMLFRRAAGREPDE